MKDRLKGKFEELKGRLTGDKVEELKGRARQKVGEGKQTADQLRDRGWHERGEPRRRDDELLDDHADDAPRSF